MAKGIITIENVEKIYGAHTALKGISFSIPEQSIFGLLGPNGAGKTTLIRLITQILLPDRGQIFFKGEVLSRRHPASMGYLPEERGLYRKMQVKEQLIYLARLRGLSKSEASKRLEPWLEKFQLGDWKNRPVETLSKGMQQKVQFIAAVLHEPELLILDEPFSGFDPVNADLLKNEILRLNREGSTILFSTHRMESVEELCGYIGLIDRAKLVLHGSVQEIKTSFRKNICLLETKEAVSENRSLYKVISREKENGIVKTRFSLNEQISANAVLAYVLNQTEIISFREEIPGMHDIFIARVKERKVNHE